MTVCEDEHTEGARTEGDEEEAGGGRQRAV